MAGRDKDAFSDFIYPRQECVRGFSGKHRQFSAQPRSGFHLSCCFSGSPQHVGPVRIHSQAKLWLLAGVGGGEEAVSTAAIAVSHHVVEEVCG